MPEVYWYLFWVAALAWVIIFAAAMMTLIHRRSMKALEILRLYAEKGLEPPPRAAELLAISEKEQRWSRTPRAPGCRTSWACFSPRVWQAVSSGGELLKAGRSRRYTSSALQRSSLGSARLECSPPRCSPQTNNMEEDDAALLAAVQEGSARAFNTLVDRHQQALRTFLRRLASREDADDIAQETFLAVWMRPGSYRGDGSFRSWLFAIAWRKAKEVHRSRFRLWRRQAAYQEAMADDEAPATTAEDGVALEQALARLPGDQRAALVMCIGFGFTHEEAARTLRLPLGTVKSHVLRGRDRLRALLGEAR